MSSKRIAVLGAVAVGAMALVGGGYAAAPSNGSSTTLITSPAAKTTSQTYSGAKTSQLGTAGAQALAASYSASCSVQQISPRKIRITVTGTAGTPTGSATFSMPAIKNGKGNNAARTQTVQLNSSGVADVSYGTAFVGRLVNVSYSGDSNYQSCSGATTVPA